MSEDSARKELAKRLRIARKQAGLPQSKAAEALGLKRPAISEIEAARRAVRAEELNTLAELYDVKVEWLLSETRDEHSAKVEIAARKLARLNSDELDQILNLFASIRDDPPDTTK